MNLPYILKIRVTERCNLRCKHCFLENKDIDIDIDRLIRIIEQDFDNKIGYVCLTGGEALLHKKLNKLLSFLHERRIKYCLASNGILLNNYNIDLLKKNEIDYLQVSLESPEEETNDYIRGSGTFTTVVNNMQKAIEEGIHVVIGFTINEKNFMYIEDMKELAERIGADIRYEVFLPIGVGKENETILKIQKESMKIAICKLKNMKSEKIKIIKPELLKKGCGAGELFATINPDLSISPCDMLCEQFKSEKISANLNFKTIWETDFNLIKWRNNMNCSDHFVGCRAASYSFKGILEGNDFFGEELMK